MDLLIYLKFDTSWILIYPGKPSKELVLLEGNYSDHVWWAETQVRALSAHAGDAKRVLKDTATHML